MLKNGENPIDFSNLVKYPCNNFENTHTEVKINRKTAFGSTTLVLTDFSNKSSALARKKSPNQIRGGEFPNLPPTDACCSDLQYPSKEGTKSITQPSNKVNISPTVCAQSKLFSSTHKKLKTAHSSEADLKHYNSGLSNRYDVSNFGLHSVCVKFLLLSFEVFLRSVRHLYCTQF